MTNEIYVYILKVGNCRIIYNIDYDIKNKNTIYNINVFVNGIFWKTVSFTGDLDNFDFDTLKE